MFFSSSSSQEWTVIGSALEIALLGFGFEWDIKIKFSPAPPSQLQQSQLRSEALSNQAYVPENYITSLFNAM